MEVTKEFYTAEEFAERLNISVNTLRAYRSRNKHGLRDVKRLLGNRYAVQEVEKVVQRILYEA